MAIAKEDRRKPLTDIGFDPDHSPSEGRWGLDQYYRVVSSRVGVIAAADRSNPYTTPTERDANMRLLAEANDMYAKLVDLCQLGTSLLAAFQEYRPGGGYAFQQALNEAVEVLGRACGATKAKFVGMTLAEIKDAVRAGRRVHWASDLYVVSYSHCSDGSEEWYIVCTKNGSTIGLTHRDGVTVNGTPDQFYIGK